MSPRPLPDPVRLRLTRWQAGPAPPPPHDCSRRPPAAARRREMRCCADARWTARRRPAHCLSVGGISPLARLTPARTGEGQHGAIATLRRATLFWLHARVCVRAHACADLVMTERCPIGGAQACLDRHATLCKAMHSQQVLYAPRLKACGRGRSNGYWAPLSWCLRAAQLLRLSNTRMQPSGAM
jgi:hypothetical protein